jgi:hypothetical protein
VLEPDLSQLNAGRIAPVEPVQQEATPEERAVPVAA